MSDAESNDVSHDFRLEKYKQLQIHYRDHEKAQVELERYALLAVGGIYGWVAAQASTDRALHGVFSLVIIILPVIVCIVVLIRFRGYVDSKSRMMSQMSEIDHFYRISEINQEHAVKLSLIPTILERHLDHYKLSGTWLTILFACFGVSISLYKS